MECAGLEVLKADHRQVMAANQEQFYGILNQEGIAEYGSSFQVVQSLHGNLGADTYFAELKFDCQGWADQGGSVGVQLMDSFFQIPLALPSHDCLAVAYAGGFEVISVMVIFMSIALVIISTCVMMAHHLIFLTGGPLYP